MCNKISTAGVCLLLAFFFLLLLRFLGWAVVKRKEQTDRRTALFNSAQLTSALSVSSGCAEYRALASSTHVYKSLTVVPGEEFDGRGGVFWWF